MLLRVKNFIPFTHYDVFIYSYSLIVVHKLFIRYKLLIVTCTHICVHVSTFIVGNKCQEAINVYSNLCDWHDTHFMILNFAPLKNFIYLNRY